MPDQVELNFNEKPREEDHPWFDMLDAKVVAAFWKFHARHPRFFEDLFMKYAKEAKAAGRKHFGASMIIERIRWYVSIEKVGTEGETYKINDHLGPCYARLAMIRYPEFDGLFELRSSNREHKEGDDYEND